MPQLAALIRAKFPGAYDDLDDAALEKSVLAKHPEYQDLATPEPPKAVDAPQAETGRDGRAVLGDAVMNFGRGVLRTVRDHPVESAATVGAIAAVPLTGGTSLLPAMAAAGLGGAGGAGLGLMVKGARGDADTPNSAGGVLRTMGEQGATQAAMEGGGGLLSKGLQATGRGFYRAAVRPATRLTEKYGDLVGSGLREGAAVGDSSAIRGRMLTSKAGADALVSQAEAAGKSVPTQAVTGRFMPLVDKAGTREALGNGTGDFSEIAQREAAFNQAHPTGQIGPTRALALKREADALAGTAQNAIRRGTATNDMTAQLHDATRSGLRQGLLDIAPGLHDQNAQTSTLYGLSRALRSAESRPHALTDILSVGAGIGGAFGGHDSGDSAMKGAATGVAMKALTSPQIQSRLGIGADRMGKVPYAQLVRLAILAAMSDGVQEQGK